MSTSRPAKLVVIAGTGTEVGKTWVAAQLAHAFRARDWRVAARKPAQSFATGSGPTDAELLAAATGEDVHGVCLPHRWYPIAMAPFMAADLLGRPPFTLADLLQELQWPPEIHIGLLESAGGVRSPITSDGADSVDLVATLRPDHVVLVADAGLGTINAVRLCVDALAPHPVVVMLNRYDGASELHRRNALWLADHLTRPVASSIAALAQLLVATARSGS